MTRDPSMPQTTPTPTGWAWASDDHWQGRLAVVLGAGESGLATARWLRQRGVTVRLVDSRPDLPLAQALAGDDTGIELLLGQSLPFSTDLLAQADLLVPSPGLSPHEGKPQSIANLLGHAAAQGLSVASELDLFDWALEMEHQAAADQDDQSPELALARPMVLAITGSNGKTTTAKLCHHLLTSLGLDVELAGNVSPSLLEALMARQRRHQPPRAWILELSSFQLAISSRFSPGAATVLNLSQDHLDWHRDYADYADAKLRVFGLPRPTGCMVVNRDDHPLLERIEALRDSLTPARSTGRAAKGKTPMPVMITFGLQPPPEQRPGFGVLKESLEWLVHQPAPWSEEDEQPPLVRLMPAQALRLRGRHHWLNAQAALALCMTVSSDLAGMLFALRDYRGETHRMQDIASSRAITFVDDSKGTNVGATVAALLGDPMLTAVILGGQGKGQVFDELGRTVVQTGAHAICIGEAGPEILQSVRDNGGQAELAVDMTDAVQKACDWILANRSDETQAARVLLSPACASFDMFQNYAHRAEVFAQSVSQQMDQWGQPC
ncbi:MAG: UDP-N-acetylmuramoyl-L-alanine--D-glutamate ligase [Burkholderiaceae bacterium]